MQTYLCNDDLGLVTDVDDFLRSSNVGVRRSMCAILTISTLIFDSGTLARSGP